VQLEVFSIDRRRIAIVTNGKVKSGAYEHRVDASSWPAGTYYAELLITEEASTPQRESLTLTVTR
jgi:hypothetical protein